MESEITQNTTNNKRIARNTAFLYVRMFFVLLISLYTSRVVLNTLGVSDYGVYNVIAGFVSLFGFLNVTLSSSMQRFYNYEGTKDIENGFRRVYTTGLIIHLILALILFIVLETFGLWYVNNVMVLPDGRLFAANILYQFSVLSMMMVLCQIPFSGAILALEKMDFYAIISIIDVLLKLAAIIALPHILFDKLILYGLFLLGIVVFDFLSYVIYVRSKILRFKIRFELDRDLFKQLLSFSGWNLFGTVIYLFKGQGLNMLLNIFFGTIVNAARGVAFQINGAITEFSGNISMAFRPQVVNAYAKNDLERFKKLSYSLSKITFSMLCFLITPVVIEIDYLLNIWLGDSVPEYTSIFAILTLLDSIVCTLIAPFTQMVFSTGNIKKYQILTSSVNILLLPISWFILQLRNNPIDVFGLTVIFSLINLGINIYIVKEIFNIKLKEYFSNVILPCIILVVILPIFPYWISTFWDSSFLRLVIVSMVDILCFGIISVTIFFDKSEKIMIFSFIKNFIKKAK